MAHDGRVSNPLPPTKRRTVRIADLRGVARLVVQGVQGVTHIAQGLHGSIARVAPPLGASPVKPVGGIAGFVYGAVRTTSAVVGAGLEAALAGAQGLLQPGTGDDESAPARDALVSALNGVLGDHLERTANPLAIPMALLPADAAGAKLMVFIHGLCMNDQQWAVDGHNAAASLATDLGATAIYLRYNTGRHISTNGGDFAALLQRRIAASPVPVESIIFVGHSMGGLVARSALHAAQQAGMAWPGLLRAMVFLGSPHHGASLERGGNWLHRGLGVSPYIAPFARLSGLRSEGITDLRHGNLLDADWAADKYAPGDERTPVPLPNGVECYAVAGTIKDAAEDSPLGDGLVTVDSALGRHKQPARDLQFAHDHTLVARGVHHLGLPGSPVVYQRLRQWLA